MKKIFYKSLDLMDSKERAEYWDGAVDHWRVITEDENHIPSDEEFEDYLRFDNECWYDCMVNDLKHVMKGVKYKIQGELGLWYGKRKVEAEAVGFEAVKKCFKSCDDICIYEERGTLKIDAYHHDGTNKFSIKEITPKGLRSPYIYKKVYGVE